ncbi:hypothetical protein [Streptomyces sp. NPDC046832]
MADPAEAVTAESVVGLVVAIAWCLGLSALGYVWSRSLFARDPK